MESVNLKAAITLVCLGIMLLAVSIPLYFGKIRMNCYYGFRVRKAFESNANWYSINRYGAKSLMCWSAVIIAIGITCVFIDPQAVLTVSKIAFVSVLVPVVQTLYYARRL